MLRSPALLFVVCAGTAVLAILCVILLGSRQPTVLNAASQPGTATLRFAVIGDFGDAGKDEERVANLVKGLNPDFIVTVGDNNYPDGLATTIDKNIGQYYHDYIDPYVGSYGPGSPSGNRFFPILGNRDWNGITCAGSSCPGPYFDYFVLPGNERYYDFVKESVHFFMLDSDPEEPDGITVSAAQSTWLQNRLASSTSPWQLVLLHHAPYSSGENHGSHPDLQWPYRSWGVDAVLAGHDHHYERIIVDGLVYFVNGIGGRNLNGVTTPVPGSQVLHTDSFGAMLIEANAETLIFTTLDTANNEIDRYQLTQPATTPTPTAISTPLPTGNERQFLPMISQN